MGEHSSTVTSKGQLQRALQDYDEAIRLDPTIANAYAGRAMVYTLLGEDTQVSPDADRAVELGFDAGFLRGTIDELRKRR